MTYIDASDGTRLFYDDWGTGTPVVFLHGWMLGADIWEYQTVPLAWQGMRCIAYDRRGCGRSSRPFDGYDYDTLADDLATVLRTLDLDDVTLVGHSMAGGEVARYATRYGLDRVGRVVLVGTTTPSGSDEAVVNASIAALLDNRPGFLAAGAPAFFGSDASEELLQWGIGLALRASPRATIELMRAMGQTDLSVDVKAIDVPTLLIHGRNDQSAPLELTGRPTAAAIAGSRLEVYETGHACFITEKDRFNGDIVEFVRSTR
jgi:pimeloyl-ACP methyl ester carboxylesterase